MLKMTPAAAHGRAARLMTSAAAHGRAARLMTPAASRRVTAVFIAVLVSFAMLFGGQYAPEGLFVHEARAAQSTANSVVKSFPDKVYEGNIWASKSRNVFYYVTEAGTGSYYNNYHIKEYNVATGAVTKIAEHSGENDYFFKDEKLYMVRARYAWGSGENPVDVRCVDLASRQDNLLFTAKLQGMTACCVGVDQSNRIYLGITGGGLAVYTSGGSLVTLSSDIPDIDGFVGFGTGGNIYYYGTYNWRYWGYDHYMSALRVCNLSSANKVTDAKHPISIQFQSGFYNHFGSCEMLDTRYLADLSTFNENQCAVLDTNQITTGKVTESSTEISLTTNAVTVSFVNLPKECVKFAENTHASEYSGNNDVGSVGTRSALDTSQNRYFVATGKKQISCYNFGTGRKLGYVNAKYNAYKTMAISGNLVVLEKNGSSFYVESMKVSPPTAVKITGPASLSVGGHGDYKATVNTNLTVSTTFSSSDKSIVSIDANGHASAWKKGTCTLTAKTDGGLTSSIKVTVSGAGISKTYPNITKWSGVHETNRNMNNYGTYANPVTSYITENSKGPVAIKHQDGGLIVLNFNKKGKLLSKRQIKDEMALFGGFFDGSDAYYVVYGQMNKAESDKLEVMRVVKYSKSWKRLSAASVYGANTYIPFDAGSLRMTEAGGKLFVHTCHEMYASSDGLHHQANMTFKISESTMKVEDSYYDVMNMSTGYVSHSFNQFIRSDGQYVYRIDHGDGYPRSIAYSKTPLTAKLDDPVTYGSIHSFAGGNGGNYTGASIGGMELSTSKVLVAFNEDVKYGGDVRNIKISTITRSGATKETHNITSLANSAAVTSMTPHLVKLNDCHFILMWSQMIIKSGKITTKITQLDQDGNRVSPIVTKNVPLSDCAPRVMKDGSVGWFVSTKYGTKLYTLNPYNISAMSNDAKNMYSVWSEDSVVTGEAAPGSIGLLSTVQKRIKAAKNDGDVKGSSFVKLKARATGGKNKVKLTWKKQKGATSYIVYGNKCGKKYKFKKLKTVSGRTCTLKGLKRGTYYKYIVVAVKDNSAMAMSKTVHVATTGGKVGNPKVVKIKAKVSKTGKKLKKWTAVKQITLKSGAKPKALFKSAKLAASAGGQGKGLKVKKHAKMRFESTNPKVAAVTKAGKVKAKKKGTCYVYAYAQNGVCKYVKVKVR